MKDRTLDGEKHPEIPGGDGCHELSTKSNTYQPYVINTCSLGLEWENASHKYNNEDEKLKANANTVQTHHGSSHPKVGTQFRGYGICAIQDSEQKPISDTDLNSKSLSYQMSEPSAESCEMTTNSSLLACINCGKDEAEPKLHQSLKNNNTKHSSLSLKSFNSYSESDVKNSDGADLSANMDEKNNVKVLPKREFFRNTNLSDNVSLPLLQRISTSTKSVFSDHREKNYSSPSIEKQTVCKMLRDSEGKDPFDLFSDDETEPKRYQPIKRKLPQNVESISKERNNYLGLHTAEDTLLTEELDNKRPKLACSVVFIHSEELLQKVNQLTRIEGRAELVYSLIQAYGLPQYIEIVPPRAASEAEILGFHSADYIDCLRETSTVSDVEETTDTSNLYSKAEAYGLSYDCPLQSGIYETASLISGGSIVAADSLIRGQADMAINWYGGWHHAKRDSASGFCYINDIVLAILKLREKFDKVLYVDLDLHHGDGVEEAFSLTSKVMTVSFHKYTTGFFPGSGALENVGSSRGKFYSVNVPLQDGIKDAEFCSIFFKVMKMVRGKFSPEAIVLQCGADGLSEDQMASFNLTHIGLAKCVCFMLAWSLPTLLLGGGGYNFASTAKCWTFLTALVARRKLPLEIPEHENLLAYGPDYQMTTTVGNRRDCNTKQYLAGLLAKISCNLKNI